MFANFVINIDPDVYRGQRLRRAVDSGVARSLEQLSFAFGPRVYREDHSYESRLAPQRVDAPWLQRPVR